ncbi:MAG: hypothetical protein ACE5JO_05350 [Candidatus Binatia bacterium]
MKRMIGKIAEAREVDLEAWETALRLGVLSAGARVLEQLLEEIGSGQQKAVWCPCGVRMESQGVRSRELVTVLGRIRYTRSRFQCPDCKKTRYPGDEALDIVGTGSSPGVRRMMARAGCRSTFKEGSEDLRVYAGLQVTAKAVERAAEGIGEDTEAWCRREGEEILQGQDSPGVGKSIPVLYISTDGTGVPMTRRELEGRPGKQPDGSARTREVKLGCVFTQTYRDERGFPLRDPDSTTFVGAIEGADAFGWRLYSEALRRGLLEAERVVVLGDGAEWIRNLAELHFPRPSRLLISITFENTSRTCARFSLLRTKSRCYGTVCVGGPP